MTEDEEKMAQKNAHIPTTEIEQDIAITESEIQDYVDETSVLERNPSGNRVRIYLLHGRILAGRAFIKDLTTILEYRKTNEGRI